MTSRKPDTRRPGPDHHPDDDTNMTEPGRVDLVAEALAVFGEEAARDLALHLRVPFEACQPTACA